MNAKTDENVPTWQAFTIELLIYAVLVTIYLVLALHYLESWFKGVFDSNRELYAAAALGIMIGQAVGLEAVCAFLFWMLRGKKPARGKK